CGQVRRERSFRAPGRGASVRRDRGEAGDGHAVTARSDAPPIRLRAANLDSIGALGVPIPGYDRKALVPRILHLGVGGFHRAHMALYTDEVAADGGDWGIAGAGLLDADRRMADVLRAQDHLYTLIERDSEGSRPRIVGSIVDYKLAAGDTAAFAQRVADPELA